MRLVLNIIWFVLAGLWMAIGYAFAALIMFVLIVTIPFGRDIVSIEEAERRGLTQQAAVH